MLCEIRTRTTLIPIPLVLKNWKQPTNPDELHKKSRRSPRQGLAQGLGFRVCSSKCVKIYELYGAIYIAIRSEMR
jgi:hypothetical protein